MKYSWLSLSVAAAILTGCTNMMYGGGVAPVSNGNTYYRQPGNYQPVDQTPQIQHRQPQTVQQAYQPHPSMPQNQPVQQNVNRVPMVPPSARQPVQQASQPQIQEQSPSPYGPQSAPPPQRTASADDGWSVKPNAGPQVSDEPKTAPQTPAPADNAAQQTAAAPKKDAPKPIRPPSREEQQAAQEEQRAEAQRSAETPAKTQQQEQPERRVASNAPSKSSSSTSAVSTLLKKANSELSKGNLDGAVRYLEDAQRIDSKNPKILYDIANIRYHQGNYRAAEAAASRAVNLGSSTAMQKKSWSLIANSRKQLGDNQGAAQAANKASSL